MKNLNINLSQETRKKARWYYVGFVWIISILLIISIISIASNLNSSELFRNKNEEMTFVQKMYNYKHLLNKYNKEENLEKLCETLFKIKIYVQKVTGNELYLEDAIYELDKRLQKEGKFLSNSRIKYIKKISR